MSRDVEKFIKIQSLTSLPGRKGKEWRALPLGMRVRVWELSVADSVAEETIPGVSNKRYIFHVPYIEQVIRGCLVTYMGEYFSILSVSDSTRLRGLELRCAPVPLERAADLA
jgi:hypothetical protein